MKNLSLCRPRVNPHCTDDESIWKIKKVMRANFYFLITISLTTEFRHSVGYEEDFLLFSPVKLSKRFYIIYSNKLSLIINSY